MGRQKGPACRQIKIKRFLRFGISQKEIGKNARNRAENKKRDKRDEYFDAILNHIKADVNHEYKWFLEKNVRGWPRGQLRAEALHLPSA